MSTQFQILVTVSLNTADGAAISQQVLGFSSRGDAEAAYNIISHSSASKSLSSATKREVLKLYEEERRSF